MEDLKIRVENIKDWIEEKKGENIIDIDISEKSSFTDYFILCNGNGTLHTKAISENIIDMAKKSGYRLLGKEGVENAKWILLDYGDIVVHIFDAPVRDYYNLEELWAKIPVRTDS